MAKNSNRSNKNKSVRKASSKTRVCEMEDCEFAGEPQPIENFGKSYRRRHIDGLMRRCRACHGKALAAGRKKGQGRARRARLSDGRSSAVVNQALEKANNGNGSHTKFMVTTSDEDYIETGSESKAMNTAREWSLEGYDVRVFKEVKFDLVAKIRE